MPSAGNDRSPRKSQLTARVRRSALSHRLQCESLEGRSLLSAGSIIDLSPGPDLTSAGSDPVEVARPSQSVDPAPGSDLVGPTPVADPSSAPAPSNATPEETADGVVSDPSDLAQTAVAISGADTSPPAAQTIAPGDGNRNNSSERTSPGVKRAE